MLGVKDDGYNASNGETRLPSACPLVRELGLKEGDQRPNEGRRGKSAPLARADD